MFSFLGRRATSRAVRGRIAGLVHTRSGFSSVTKKAQSETELFQQLTKQLVPMIGKYIQESENVEEKVKVIDYMSPAALKQEINFTLPDRGHADAQQTIQQIQKTMDYSVRTSHGKFLDKLYAGSEPVGQIGEWVSAVLNTNVHTYACAPVFSVMEVELITRMCELMGYQDGDGIFCPGGSFANLMAMLVARDSHPESAHVRQQGMHTMDKRLIVLASPQAHYSVKRAVAVMGLGFDAIHYVDTDQQGRMYPEAVRAAFEEHKQAGNVPFFLHTTAGTTVTGGFDHFDELADIAHEYGSHIHVDGAWGGSVVMSETHKSLLAGVEKADSITWNPHKMMGIPLQTSVLLTKDKGALNRTNNLNAEYLFHVHENSAYDLGDKTLQCGRKSDALKFWLSWQFYGKEGYAARIDHAFDMAAHFTALVNQSDNFELVQDPVSLNVCFWYKDSTGKTRPDLTAKVYDHVQQNNGSMLVNFNPLSDHDLQPFFRIIMNSPKISETSCQEILDDIVEAAQVLEAAEQQQ